MFIQTYQIWLLTAWVIHFCPSKKMFSDAAHLVSAQELLPAWLLRSNKFPCPGSWGEWLHLCSPEKVGARRGDVSSSEHYFGLLWSPRGREKTSVFPTLGEHSFREPRPFSSPKNKPPCPLSLSPPTYTHIYTHFTHTLLGSKISGQQGWPENSRKHQKQLQKLFMSECECVIWGVYMCSASP